MESAGAGAQGGGIRWEYPFKEKKKKQTLIDRAVMWPLELRLAAIPLVCFKGI